MMLGNRMGGVTSIRPYLHIYWKKSSPISLSKAEGQTYSINHNTDDGRSPQWAVMVMGICRALLLSSRLGEFLCLAWRRVEESNFLTSMACHSNPSCRTGRKNWDGKLFCSFKPYWGIASSPSFQDY